MKMTNQTFLFTGTLTELTREEAEALVESNGGKVLSGVSAKLNYLVVGEDAGSKLTKAKTIKTIKILSEKEFLKMVPKSSVQKTEKASPKKKAVPMPNPGHKSDVSKTKEKKSKVQDISNSDKPFKYLNKKEFDTVVRSEEHNV